MSGPRLAALLLPLAAGTLLTYWGWRLYAGLSHSLRDELPDLGSLARYLAGIVLVLLAIWAVAHANYHFSFRRWLGSPATNAYYWLWLCGLAGLLFEGLQLRTTHEPDFVDENLLVTVVFIGFVTAYGYIADSVHNRQQRVVLLEQKAQAELTALKAQVNPHFLFNALNTIYNEAQKSDSQHVVNLIQQLSGLMRYTLEESAKPLTMVDNEVQFIEKYIALQRARLPTVDPPRLTVRVDTDDQPTPIAPLLLIPFVENAFQHGISVTQPSFIEIIISAENQQLSLSVTNSLLTYPHLSTRSGTGIANVRQRLALTYPNRHTLAIGQTDSTFSVRLTLSL